MTRGLNSPATIATTAPLLGVLASCFGIASAFKGCGGEKWTCLAGTVEGLSEALIPTAFGLAVAIVASLGYRSLRACVDRFEVEMRNLSTQLLNCLILAHR